MRRVERNRRQQNEFLCLLTLTLSPLMTIIPAEHKANTRRAVQTRGKSGLSGYFTDDELAELLNAENEGRTIPRDFSKPLSRSPHVCGDNYCGEERVQKFMWEFNHSPTPQPHGTPKQGRRL